MSRIEVTELYRRGHVFYVDNSAVYQAITEVGLRWTHRIPRRFGGSRCAINHRSWLTAARHWADQRIAATKAREEER